MTRTLIYLISICLLPLIACSDDKAETLSFDELKIELDSNGFITSPAWMKQLVDDSKQKLPSGLMAPGIMMFTGVYIDDTPYIKTGLIFSSYSCEAFQVYRINGEKLECGSEEYKKVMVINEGEDPRILWRAPLLLK